MSHTPLAAGNSSPHLKSILPVMNWQEVPPHSKSDDLSVNEANNLKLYFFSISSFVRLQ